MRSDTLCEECDQMKGKTARTRPHGMMLAMNDRRVFGGRPSKGYEEQDYRCARCQARFTFSTNKNDQAWTLWQG